MAALALALDGDVVAARSGDRNAFTRLVDSCRNVVCAITLAIVRDVSASEDVAQDVFLAAWGSLQKLRNPASFLPWLRQLARNHAHEFIRSKVRYRRRHAPWADDVDAVPDAAVDAQSRLIDDEEARALAAAIEELPDETREIVTLYYREGSSARQVADLLGLSEDAVKKRLERSRDVLKSAMLERFADSVRKSAPGAGFTAAVAAAIVVASPGTAAAAGLGITKSLGHVSLLGKIAAFAGGAVIGGASALAAVLFGVRMLLRRARDDEEREALRRFGVTNTAFVVAVSAAEMIAPRVSESEVPLVLIWLAFVLALVWSYMIWLPRIIARRLAVERLEDPDAFRRQRRDRIRATIGTIVGVSTGLAGLLYGLAHR